MGGDQEAFSQEDRDELRRDLCSDHAMSRRYFRLLRLLPSDPRCKFCRGPFAGVGGKLLGLRGYAPSRKNPRFCNT